MLLSPEFRKVLNTRRYIRGLGIVPLGIIELLVCTLMVPSLIIGGILFLPSLGWSLHLAIRVSKSFYNFSLLNKYYGIEFSRWD